MPLRWRSLVLCLLLVGFLRAEAITVRITEADGTRVQVSLYCGDVLRVDLPAEPAAGLQWSASGHTPAPLEMLAATQRVFGGRLSVHGTSSFAWRAISAGDADLMLDYGFPASRTVHPDRTVRVHVTIANRLSPAGQPIPEAPPYLQNEVYTRTEPCGDCSALEENLSLFSPDNGSSMWAQRFVLRRRYKDAPGGTLTMVTAGLWKMRLGTADPTATVYHLTGADVDYLLRADRDRLTPLDAQQIPVPSPPGVDNAFHLAKDSFHRSAVP